MRRILALVLVGMRDEYFEDEGQVRLPHGGFRLELLKCLYATGRSA